MRNHSERLLACTCCALSLVVTTIAAAEAPGQIFRDCDDCPEMVVVRAGTYQMGSPANEEGHNGSESTRRKVTIAEPFAVGRFEVTFAEWDACVSGGGCKYSPGDNGWGRGRRPVINVSWEDATSQYLPWLTKKSGKAYRLLFEAEWEYAARAGTTTRYAFGNSITRHQAQFSSGSWGSSAKTAKVGSFEPNAFGLYDMHGNVWEWAEDCYHRTYAPANDTTLPSSDCSRRVIRGGSWRNYPSNLRSARRIWDYSADRLYNLGFRVGRTLTP